LINESFAQKNKIVGQLKMEYVNEKFKEMLRINGESLPSNTDENGSELLKVILNLEIFEEQAQYNDNMDESEGDDN
jgi:hypothetical protein